MEEFTVKIYEHRSKIPIERSDILNRQTEEFFFYDLY